MTQSTAQSSAELAAQSATSSQINSINFTDLLGNVVKKSAAASEIKSNANLESFLNISPNNLLLITQANLLAMFLIK